MPHSACKLNKGIAIPLKSSYKGTYFGILLYLRFTELPCILVSEHNTKRYKTCNVVWHNKAKACIKTRTRSCRGKSRKSIHWSVIRMEEPATVPKRKVGRPTKLDAAMMEKAKGYLAWCGANPVEASQASFQGKFTDTEYVPKLPNLAGFMLYLGITDPTLADWEENNEEFSSIVVGIRKRQEELLLELGGSGRYNPTIAKLLLSKHGYHEKSEVEVTGNVVGITISPPAEQENG